MPVVGQQYSMLNVPASNAATATTTTVTSPGRPATKVKSTRNQNCFCLTQARAQAAKHTRSVRFCVRTMTIISARFRLVSRPLLRSISPGNSKASSPAQPGPSSHSLTDADRQRLLIVYKLDMLCLCSRRQDPQLALARM
jgi:hypothetical protein